MVVVVVAAAAVVPEAAATERIIVNSDIGVFFLQKYVEKIQIIWKLTE
jgi:hypothetical protein